MNNMTKEELLQIIDDSLLEAGSWRWSRNAFIDTDNFGTTVANPVYDVDSPFAEFIHNGPVKKGGLEIRAEGIEASEYFLAGEKYALFPSGYSVIMAPTLQSTIELGKINAGYPIFVGILGYEGNRVVLRKSLGINTGTQNAANSYRLSYDDNGSCSLDLPAGPAISPTIASYEDITNTDNSVDRVYRLKDFPYDGAIGAAGSYSKMYRNDLTGTVMLSGITGGGHDLVMLGLVRYMVAYVPAGNILQSNIHASMASDSNRYFCLTNTPASDIKNSIYEAQE